MTTESASVPAATPNRRIGVRADWLLEYTGSDVRHSSGKWVLADGDRIAYIGDTKPDGLDEIIDEPDSFVLPGFINLHHHCFSETLVRSLTEDWPSGMFEQRAIYGLLLPATRLSLEVLSPEQRRDIARLGLLQAVKGGATTVVDVFRPENIEIFEAAAEIGLRLYGAPYVFSTSIEDATQEADLEPWIDLHARYHGRDSGRLAVMLSPHAPDTVGPRTLRAVHRLAEKTGCLITTHLAQSAEECSLVAERYGRTPAEYLDWTGILETGPIAAHGLYCTDDDLALLRRTGATIANCPSTYARGGISNPFGRFSGAGVRTVIATDGYATDMLSEMRLAGIVSKLAARNSGVVTAQEILRSVTCHPAAALRRSDLGRIAIGAKADLTVVSLAAARHKPLSDPIKALVWHAGAADVTAVIVDGRALVLRGRCVTIDEVEAVTRGTSAVIAFWSSPRGRQLLTANGGNAS